MKSLIKKIIVYILTLEARLVLMRHKPFIIGITGSVGKTSTKEVVAAVVSQKYITRKSKKSFNSPDFGVALTILNEDTAWGSILGWLGVMWRGLLTALFSRTYPEALVLEMGIDAPGDMQSLSRWVPLDAAVITHIGTTPVHTEAFSSPEAVAREKMYILDAIKPHGFVVLTHDDPVVMKYKERIKQRVFTFGFEEGAMVKGGYYTITYDAFGAPTGIAAKILIGSNAFPFIMAGAIGRQFVYPTIAATAVGQALDINMVEILSALDSVKLEPGRMRLIAGAGETLLIDDSYNSSPIAAREAVAALGDIRVRGKRIAILGDMRELGKLSKDAHREIGKLVADVADKLATVGEEAAQIAVGAQEAGLVHVRPLATPEEALAWVRKEMHAGDVVLIKGSQGIRLEKVVKGLLADERDVKKLVRQGVEWEVR